MAEAKLYPTSSSSASSWTREYYYGHHNHNRAPSASRKAVAPSVPAYRGSPFGSISTVASRPPAHGSRLPSLPTVGRVGLRPPSSSASSSSSRIGVTAVSAATAEGGSRGGSSETTCDRCDGRHETVRCPYFKRPREEHRDAWVNKGRKTPREMGGNGGSFVLRSARVVQQPPDGSCLYHSLSYGLGGTSAHTLRREIAAFVERNPELKIADDPLKDWVYWDQNCSVSQYCRRMSISGWGGGIEMAACSHLKGVNIHVYERSSVGFQRISCFDYPGASKTIHVLYCGGVHYNSLVV